METKICCRCKRYLALENFNYKFQKFGIRQKACKDCTRLEIRNHYYQNKAYYLNKAKKRNKKIRKIARKYIWNYLISHPCVDCGEKNPVVLEFDHLNSKTDNIANLIKKDSPVDKLTEEIEKCVIRCANCHRKKTARDFNWYKNKFAPVA